VAESIRRPATTPGAAALPRPAEALRSLVSARLAPVTLFALALGLGILVRISVVSAGQGFPLNDGGMFLAMIEDVRAHHYALPELTSYNGGDIPFAYPPLPFYAAAALGDVFGISSIDVLIYLPLLFSILTIPAFWLLARSMLSKPLYASLAALLFASMPRSFNWEVVGGGLTRSPGFFFATLALWQTYELFRDGKRSHLLPAVALSALSILCHMEMGWFVAFSALFFLLWHRKQPATLPNAALLAAGVALLTAPWYLGVVLRSGIEPLFSAVQTGGHSPFVLLTPLMLRFGDDAFFPLALVLSLLGLLATVRDHRYLLPLWLLVIFVLDPRKAATVSTLPLAMLAAIGLVEVIWPLVRREIDRDMPRWAFAAAGFFLLLYAPVAAIASSTGSDSPLHALPEAQREAMAWSAANTPSSATFVVMPSANRWANDAPSEWFPALSGRISLNTVQGAEWLGKREYQDRQQEFQDLAECAGSDATCLDAWIAASGDHPSHVYVPKGDSAAGTLLFNRQGLDCCRALLDSLRTSADYRVVFENEGAIIFERLSP
jgi:hypothetical protein